MEEWRLIEDFPNYEVSSLGFVRRKNGGLLKPMKNSNGYFFVDLGREGRGRFLARLVASAFLVKSSVTDEVDHINRIKTDNRVENLRWVSRSLNLQNTNDRYTSTGERCIYKTPTSYLVQIIRNNKCVYRKNFDTLEGAIQNRNLFLNSYTQAQSQSPCIQDQPSAPQ